MKSQKSLVALLTIAMSGSMVTITTEIKAANGYKAWIPWLGENVNPLLKTFARKATECGPTAYNCVLENPVKAATITLLSTGGLWCAYRFGYRRAQNVGGGQGTGTKLKQLRDQANAKWKHEHRTTQEFHKKTLEANENALKALKKTLGVVYWHQTRVFNAHPPLQAARLQMAQLQAAQLQAARKQAEALFKNVAGANPIEST